MTTKSYNHFFHQLDLVIKKYPNLKITELDGFKFLKGILEIKNDKCETVGNFSIEIKYRKEFPYRFPYLYEVGGDIPNLANWHKYQDDSCCITVYPDEILKCKDGITLLSFIENYAIPYFANQLYRLQYDKYLNGEYSHGNNGLIEFYSALFKTTDRLKWREYVNIVSLGKTLKMERNKPCFCGSGLKYKFCHDKIFYNIKRIGVNLIINDLNHLIE